MKVEKQQRPERRTLTLCDSGCHRDTYDVNAEGYCPACWPGVQGTGGGRARETGFVTLSMTIQLARCLLVLTHARPPTAPASMGD